MLDLWQRVTSHPDFWRYASIPFVAGVVGWATNWVAVKLTFLPLEPWGKPPWLGWQGIIPTKARKMSDIFVDSTMARLGTLKEFFDEMNPERIGDQVVEVMAPRMREYTDQIVREQNALVWETLPEVVREQIYRRVDDQLPRLVHEMMGEIGARVEELIDLKQMIGGRLVRDKALLNRLFTESGDAEFRFIVRSGFGFGFLFGLIQLAVWIFLPSWWVLPLAGLLVGYATNWIALNIIFRPLNPVRLGPFVLQGLFLKRQKEVAAVWCAIVTQEIMTLGNIVDNLLHGTHAEQTRELIRSHMRPIVDESIGAAKGLAQVAVGVEGFANMRERVADHALAVSTAPFNDPTFEKDRGHVVEKMLRERMEQLPSVDFQDLLRPCFQEDEWKLILLGAILGLLAGTGQLFFVFGGIG